MNHRLVVFARKSTHGCPNSIAWQSEGRTSATAVGLMIGGSTSGRNELVDIEAAVAEMVVIHVRGEPLE
jgi:hypothetical protein